MSVDRQRLGRRASGWSVDARHQIFDSGTADAAGNFTSTDGDAPRSSRTARSSRHVHAHGPAGQHRRRLDDLQGRQLPRQAQGPQRQADRDDQVALLGLRARQEDLHPRPPQGQDLHARRSAGRRRLRDADKRLAPPARRARRRRSPTASTRSRWTTARSTPSRGRYNQYTATHHDLQDLRQVAAAAASSSSTPAAGSGRARRKPWASGQPSSARKRRCASVSTPSATATRPERARQPQDGGDEGRGLAVVGDLAQEGAVDLERLDRHLAQARQRGVARAEVVEGELEAQGVQRAQDGLATRSGPPSWRTP